MFEQPLGALIALLGRVTPSEHEGILQHQM